MDSEEIEERAEKTLREADTYRVPIQVDKVARFLNLTIDAVPLGDKVSGLLFVNGERGAIGYEGCFAATAPADADVADVAKAIVNVVGMPFGKRPFRVHIDPAQDGAEIVNAVLRPTTPASVRADSSEGRLRLPARRRTRDRG